MVDAAAAPTPACPLCASPLTRAALALDVEVIPTPSCILFSSLILHTKYTGLRENGFNVYA
jgi:hypothetical protein